MRPRPSVLNLALAILIIAEGCHGAFDQADTQLSTIGHLRTTMDRTSDDVQKAYANQQEYLERVINQFFGVFEPVFWFDCREFSEVFSRYLFSLKRMDLLDDLFQTVLRDAWTKFLREHPRAVIEPSLPKTFVRKELTRLAQAGLNPSRVRAETADQLQTWTVVQPQDYEGLFQNAATEMSALQKIQKGRYIAKNGDKMRHVFFSLEKYLNQRKQRESLDSVAAQAKSFFEALTFTKWLEKAEAEFLVDIFHKRLRELNSSKAAVRNIEDLIATVENQDSLARFIDRLESEASSSTADQIERLIELEREEKKTDKHLFGFFEQFFRHFKRETPLSPDGIIRKVKGVYFPEFEKQRHLFDAFRRFFGSLGFSIREQMMPELRFYLEELGHFCLIDAQEKAEFLKLIDKILGSKKQIAKDTFSPENAKNLLKELGLAEPIVVVVAPLEAGVERRLSFEDLTSPKEPKNMHFVQIVRNVGTPGVLQFQVSPSPRELKKFYKNPDFLTNTYYGVLENVLIMNKGHAATHRRISNPFFQK
jgi:hypothetical protein